MRFLTCIVALVLALVLPASAIARPRATVAPPGDSGISQYLEVVPTAAGGSPPHAGPGTGGGAQGGALTASQRRQLNAAGPDGLTLTALVDGTAPQSVGVVVRAAGRPANLLGPAGGSAGGSPGRSGASANPESDAGAPLRSDRGSSPVSMILASAAGQGDGGLGVLFAAFIAASLLAVTLVALRRRRASP